MREKIDFVDGYCGSTQLSEGDLGRVVESVKNPGLFHDLDDVLHVIAIHAKIIQSGFKDFIPVFRDSPKSRRRRKLADVVLETLNFTKRYASRLRSIFPSGSQMSLS